MPTSPFPLRPSSRRAQSRRIASILALLLALSPPAEAWEPEGNLICGAVREQFVPRIASDGAGGAYIAWGDYRNGTFQSNVYLTRITPNGDLHPGWPVDGMALTGPPNTYGLGWIIADGEGGCYVAWTGRIPGAVEVVAYLQRVGPDGSLPPGWPLGGVRMSHAPSPTNPQRIRLASDGHDGVYATWFDFDVHFNEFGNLQHYLGDGTIAPGWSGTERKLSPGALFSSSPNILADGEGGVFATWVDAVEANRARVLLQRYTFDGAVHQGWPEAGALLADLSGTRGTRSIASDFAGGAYVVWDDLRFARMDIYAARVRPDGTIPPGWPANGLKLCDAIENQNSSQLCADGFGGFIAIWQDVRDLVNRVYAIRVDSLGQRKPGWPENGVRVSTSPNQQLTGYSLVADGLGGAYVGWTDVGSTSPSILRVQHLTGTGTVAPGWPPEGLEIAPPGLGQNDPDAISDDAGGLIITWQDGRYGINIYAQHVGPVGVVGIALSLVNLESVPGEVRVSGLLVGELQPVVIERREPAGAWQPIATVAPEGSGRIEYVDRDVVAGARYGYRLGAGTPRQYSAESWTDVPGELRLALDGLRPNPSSGPMRVAFTLPREGEASLELLDVSGRRVSATEVGSLGPGRHLVTWQPARLEPGLYWLRLTHAGETRSIRAIVTR